jgi:hypothetical protein
MNEYNYPKEQIKKVKEGLQFENWTNKNGEETIKYINSIVNGKSRETIYLAFSNIAPVSVIEASFTNLQLLWASIYIPF